MPNRMRDLREYRRFESGRYALSVLVVSPPFPILTPLL